MMKRRSPSVSIAGTALVGLLGHGVNTPRHMDWLSASIELAKTGKMFPQRVASGRWLPFHAAALPIQAIFEMKNKCLILSAFVVWAGFLLQTKANAILDSAVGFAVLGGSTVTSTGNSVLNGDLGVSPGSAITGFPPGTVHGSTYTSGLVVQQAKTDAFTAYMALKNETPVEDLTGQDLGGLTLTPGVRSFSSSAQLTGTLTLDAQGDPNARFDFQIGSTLTTASSSSVRLINGAQADNVFWEVGSSATLGTDTIFNGSILADQSITLDTAASVLGRALAMNAAVTMDDNLITVPTDVPEPASLWLLAVFASVFGTGRWLAGRRRKARGGSI